MLAPRESFSITSLAALREISALKPKSNMSKSQAEVVLASFVAKGWLLKSKQVASSYSARYVLITSTGGGDTPFLRAPCLSFSPISSRPILTKSSSV